MARFLASVLRLGECTAINNVIRRAALGDDRMERVPGPDLLLLSKLLFWGPAHLVPTPSYYRRDTKALSERLKRLGGDRPVEADFSLTANLYRQLFDRLSKGQRGRSMWKPLVHFAIRWRYDWELMPWALRRRALRFHPSHGLTKQSHFDRIEW